MRLYGSAFGGWLVHLLLPGSWVLGTPCMIGVMVVSVWCDWYKVLTVAVIVSTAQLVMPIPAWPMFQRFVMKLDGGVYYAKCRLKIAAPIAETKTLLAYHPHGVLGSGWAWNGVVNEELNSKKNVTWFVATAVFQLPLFSFVLNFCGNVRGANHAAMKRHMAKGTNCALLPGGFEEATIMRYQRERVYLRHRKGFVKFCLRYGYKLQPVYTFGEADTYWNFPYLLKLRLALNRLKIPGVFFFGNPFFPPFPRTDASLLTVVGPALNLPHIPEPSDKDVDTYHQQYLKALTELFDKHKQEAGFPHRNLEVF